MAFTILGLVLIVAAAVLRIVSSGSDKAARVKLVSYVMMIAGLAMPVMGAVVLVDVGEVGVKHFLGRVSPGALEQGVHIVNPFAKVEKMSIREQAFPQDSGVERIEAQTSEQLNVTLDVSLLYRIDGADAPDLYQRIGSERQIKSRIVLNAVRNGVRDAIATKSINQIFSPDRREIAADMKAAIQVKAGDRIDVLDVFVRDIQAPERVQEAIEERQRREQQVAQEQFQTQIIEERARQAIEEAKGIAEAQRIISEGLTPAYLTFHYIETLKEMPGGSVVYVPTEGGIPLIRNLGPG